MKARTIKTTAMMTTTVMMVASTKTCSSGEGQSTYPILSRVVGGRGGGGGAGLTTEHISPKTRKHA